MKSTATRTQQMFAQQKRLAKNKAASKDHSSISLLSRLYFGVIAGVIGAGLGFLFDLLLSFARAIFHAQAAGEFIWFLSYMLGSVGLLVGLIFASKSGELFAQLFNLHDSSESNASSELIRIIAKALFIVMLGWSIFVIFL
jgi:hypothetical protein